MLGKVRIFDRNVLPAAKGYDEPKACNRYQFIHSILPRIVAVRSYQPLV